MLKVKIEIFKRDRSFQARLSIFRLGLESRGPGIDPFRASGPKWGRKWRKNGFWHDLKNGGKMARKMGKMAQKMEKIWHENGSKMEFRAVFRIFRAVFPPFSGPWSKSTFVPISGRRPEMDLYQVHGIPRLGPLGKPKKVRLAWPRIQSETRNRNRQNRTLRIF